MQEVILKIAPELVRGDIDDLKGSCFFISPFNDEFSVFYSTGNLKKFISTLWRIPSFPKKTIDELCKTLAAEQERKPELHNELLDEDASRITCRMPAHYYGCDAGVLCNKKLNFLYKINADIMFVPVVEDPEVNRIMRNAAIQDYFKNFHEQAAKRN